MRRLLPAVVLAGGLWGGVASADEPREPPPQEAKAAKAPAPDKAPLSEEDREVVENLELLESLEEAKDLDLVEALLKDEE